MLSHFPSKKKMSFVVIFCITAFSLLFFMKSWGSADKSVSDDFFAEQLKLLAQLIREERVDDLRSLLQEQTGALWLQEDATKVTILNALDSRCPADIIFTLATHDGMLLFSSEGTPFHRLAFSDSIGKAIECMDVLIRAGVDINAVDSDGHTALVSILFSHQEKTLAVLEHLLDRGADPAIRSHRGLDLMHHTLKLRLLYLPLLPYNNDDDFQPVMERMVELTEQVELMIGRYFLAQ